MIQDTNILNHDELEKIHKATMEIMENVGILFHHDRAIELFKKNGYRVDGHKVFFTEDQVMDCVKQCPRSFVWRGRNPEKSALVGGGTPVYTAGSGYIHVITPEGRRSATLLDTINYAKLLQSSQFIGVHGGNLVSASDVGPNIAIPHTMLFAWLLSDKPMMGIGYVDEYLKISLDMARMIFGETDDYVCMGNTNPMAPLAWDENMTELIFEFAGAGQPIEIGTLGTLGGTHPIHMAASLATANAELLAGLVMTQLIKPGVPVVPGVISTKSDMRTMSCVMGAPEEALMAAAFIQIAHHYDLPSRGGGSLTDAKVCDAQGGAETMMNFLLPAMAGVDLVPHIAMCDSFNCFSYEKFIMDEDILALVKEVAKGITVNDNTLCIEEIKQNGPGVHYMTCASTLANCRAASVRPQVFNRDGYDTLQSKNGLDIEANATRIWKERIESFTAPDMDPALARDLWDYVETRFGTIGDDLKALVQ